MEMEPGSPALESRVLTPGPPGSPACHVLGVGYLCPQIHMVKP